MNAPTLSTLLAYAIQSGASDLHLSTGEMLYLRIDGSMTSVSMLPLSHDDIIAMLGIHE